MTEAEWNACTQPGRMLEFLRADTRMGWSPRKERLFAVACCRRLGRLPDDELARWALGVAERYADGLADDRERMAAFRDFLGGSTPGPQVTAVAHGLYADSARPGDAHGPASEAVARGADPYRKVARDAEAAAQAHLLRDVAGTTFPPPAVDPSWLAWQGGAVAQLVRVVYEEQRFADVGVLGDALEDAGCADPHILAHCRQRGEHVKGCWVVDLLLGKK